MKNPLAKIEKAVKNIMNTILPQDSILFPFLPDSILAYCKNE